jgi:DnaJ family protein C protein 2
MLMFTDAPVPLRYLQVKLAGEAATTLVPNGNSSSSSATGAAAAASSSSAASDSTQAEPAAAAAAAAKPKKVVADSGVWNEEQELALVQALKQFGKELPDRWERISGVVPGKSKAACFKRFKELKEVFKAKKTG